MTETAKTIRTYTKANEMQCNTDHMTYNNQDVIRTLPPEYLFLTILVSMESEMLDSLQFCKET